jgi:hypothetical protein
MTNETDERRSHILLGSLFFFLVLSAFVQDDWISELVLALSMYAVLILALLKVYEKHGLPWPAILLTCASLMATLAALFHPVHSLMIINWLLLSLFFGYVSVALFWFVERSQVIIRAKLAAAVGLYLILGMFYYAVFNLLQEVRPGSFMEAGPPREIASRHSLLYLSLATLTTVGYGDVLAVSRPARMLAVLEGITGVFYIAVTVARLVSAYQNANRE